MKPKYICGTLKSYKQGKCKCAKCRAANSRYVRESRAMRDAKRSGINVADARTKMYAQQLLVLGLTQSQIAETSGVSISTVSALLAGDRVSPETSARLREAWVRKGAPISAYSTTHLSDGYCRKGHLRATNTQRVVNRGITRWVCVACQRERNPQ